ncbi:GNAT family N-acetyltransferase [Nguyenibacter vanlangensis]|uniref:GNAT family N-acetyltransferase n=1 Tax=Nguyenibacter vanlangensis TaxID=1216886 RepID=A0A7Y7IWG2_9PROT|nr:GNAT family N-acetyltransferase [Nguyenibacter vanlangensis]NVN11628.1 GNAT family N-acetyltransferase [Nguyenibacter vanlangensis]
MTRYGVEAWSAVLLEMRSLWEAHFREVALEQERVPLDPDLETYARLEQAGALHVLTMREGRVLAGYLVALVWPHLHHRGTSHAFFDLYYVRPAYRRWTAGIRLFREAERTLAARGVRRMIAGTKIHVAPTGRSLDVGPIFRRLGWVEMERQFGKWIGSW